MRLIHCVMATGGKKRGEVQVKSLRLQYACRCFEIMTRYRQKLGPRLGPKWAPETDVYPPNAHIKPWDPANLFNN